MYAACMCCVFGLNYMVLSALSKSRVCVLTFECYIVQELNVLCRLMPAVQHL